MPEANRTVMRLQWRLHKALWNVSGGRLGRRAVGMPVVEVLTVGRRSGVKRQILITYVDDGGCPTIVGTNAGRGTDPAWALNLRARPNVSARWDGRWHQVEAVEIGGEAWERAWEAAVAINPGYADYAKDLTRPIPIFRLEPQDRPSAGGIDGTRIRPAIDPT